MEVNINMEVLMGIDNIIIDPVWEDKQNCIVDSEFMLLRYNIQDHPLILSKKKYKILYYNLLKYMLNDLDSTSAVIKTIMRDYAQIFNLMVEDIASLDQFSAFKNFKKTKEKEFLCSGWFKYNFRDYRCLLIIEVFYFRYVLKNTIEYDLINKYCELLDIKGAEKDAVVKYIKSFVKQDNDIKLSFLNHSNKCFLSAILYLQSNIDWNNTYNELKKYNVAVCATMSSGKSTFINALLGKDYIPSKNEVCTAKITSIADDDRLDSAIGIMVDTNGNRVCRTYIDRQLLEEWNNSNEVWRIMLEADFDEVSSENGILVVTDTPGTNYSQDKSHYDITMDFLKTNLLDMIIYIINAEHVSTTDNEFLLKQIKAEVIDKKSTKIIFLVNKLDSFDSEKNDDISKCLEEVKKELIEYGYNNPIIMPIVANAAKLFKMVLKGQPLTQKEMSMFRNFFDLFFHEQFDLLESYAISNQMVEFDDRDNTVITIENKVYKKTDILKALQRTGINSVETLLNKEINARRNI